MSHFNKRFKELLKANESERSLPLPLPPSHLRTCYTTLHKLLLLSPERKLITQGARVTKLTNYRMSTYKNKDEQVQLFWQVCHSHCANSEVQNLFHGGGILPAIIENYHDNKLTMGKKKQNVFLGVCFPKDTIFRIY